MPFTLSHPAVAAAFWPAIRRGHVPLAALAIGAMSPDFEFLLRLRPVTRWSHTLGGLVLFCLPAGLVVLLAWERIARGPVRHLLALDREPRALHRGGAWWLRASLAIVAGAATHMLWDGFTHGGYWGAELMPALRAPALSAFGTTIPWFNLLQHASTLVGGITVLGWLAAELRRTGATPVIARSRWRWAVLATLGGVALCAGLLNGAWSGSRGDYWSAQMWLGRVAVGGMLGLGLAGLCFAALHRLRDASPGALAR